MPHIDFSGVMGAAGRVFEHALASLQKRDEFEHRRIVRELERGGRLRLVCDSKAGVRVRLLVGPESGGRNRWVFCLKAPPVVAPDQDDA